jgi:hypothetical protein
MINRVLAWRHKSDRWKVRVLTFYCTYVMNLRADPPDDPYLPVSAPGTPDDVLDTEMDTHLADNDLSQTTQGPGTPASAASQSASAASPSATAASPHAAAASSTDVSANTRGGRPAVKAAGGKAAQAVAKQAYRVLHDGKPREARRLLGEELATGQPGVGDISAEHATKQAKTAVNSVFERASLVISSL